MFYEIFFSPQVKRSVTITNKHIYSLVESKGSTSGVKFQIVSSRTQMKTLKKSSHAKSLAFSVSLTQIQLLSRTHANLFISDKVSKILLPDAHCPNPLQPPW